MKKIISLILILSILGCEDQFLHKLPRPDSEVKVFVHCVLEPGSTSLKAQLFLTKEIYGPLDESDYEPVSDATVQISGPTQTYTLQFVNILNDPFYGVNIPADFIREGNEYHLSITTKEGKLLTATTVVPFLNVEDVDLMLDSITISFEHDLRQFLINTRFKDAPRMEDYYQISGYYVPDTTQNERYDLLYEPPLYLISDKGNDGEVLEQFARGAFIDDFDSLKFYFYIQSVSRDLYLYNYAMNSYASFTYSPDNPFVEPTIMHTNISGGLGIFGARNVQLYEFIK